MIVSGAGKPLTCCPRRFHSGGERDGNEKSNATPKRVTVPFTPALVVPVAGFVVGCGSSASSYVSSAQYKRAMLADVSSYLGQDNHPGSAP